MIYKFLFFQQIIVINLCFLLQIIIIIQLTKYESAIILMFILSNGGVKWGILNLQ